MPKLVCGSIFADCVSEIHLRLSSDGESKDIGQYSWALDNIFGKLSKDEVAQCTTLIRVQHGYGNTHGVSKMGHTGSGTVWEFGNRGYTVPVTVVSRCH